MKTLEQIFDIIEKNDISIDNYTENDILCGYELNSYTNAGVNEILFLDFRDEDKDPKNPQHFITEFEDYINHYSIDDRIDSNRQGKDYCNHFTIAESLKDFTAFDEHLRDILSELKDQDKAQTPEQNETFYFTLIDEEGKTAGIIHTGNSRQLESFVMDCATEHYSVDDVSIPESLEIAKLDWGVQKTITVTCYIGKEPPIYYDMVIEKSVAYGNKPSQEKTVSELKQVHKKIRDILIDYGNEEYGDCIIDEISEAVGIQPTTVYYNE